MKAKGKKKAAPINRYGEVTYKPYKAPPKKKAAVKKLPPREIANLPRATDLEIPAQPQPKQEEEKNNMAEQQQIDAMKEAASRVSGKIRNLENEINATRPTPPDPALAEKFDAIQRDLEALKNPESAHFGPDNGDEDEKDNGKKAKKK